MKTLMGGLLAVLTFVLGLGGIVLHLYTILIAHEGFGFLSALLAFIFPVIAQIYWVFKTIAITGLWLNFYTFWVLLYAGGWILWVLLAGLHGAICDRSATRSSVVE